MPELDTRQPPPPAGEPAGAPTGPNEPDAPVGPPPGPPRLTRSRDDRVVAGVAAGIARHIGLDPVLLRLAFVVLVLAGGSGVLAYLVAWLVIPEEPAGGTAPAAAPTEQAPMLRAVVGGVLVLLGATWLLQQVVPGIARITWPVALIVVGALVIVAGGRR